MNRPDSPFITDPRISGIGRGNRETTVKNISKHNVLTDRFNVNAKKFSFINCNNNYIKVEYTNIRSVLNKIDILENYLYLNNIDLFFLTETWLTTKVNDAIVCPSNYNIFRNDRSSRGGGVAIIFKNSLKVIKVKNDFISTNNVNFEYLCVDVMFKKIKLRFCCIYLPPLSARCALTVKNVIKMIKMFFPKDCSFYILGDFNMPNIDWTIPSTDFNEPNECFLNFCTDNFLTQVIESPTHKNGNILDLLICNHFGLDRIISH